MDQLLRGGYRFEAVKRVSLVVVGVGVVALLRLVTRGVEVAVSWDLLFLLLGGLVGLGMPLVDRLVYVYLSRPGEPLSVEVRHLISERKLLKALEELVRRQDEQQQLTLSNVLFMGVWVVLAVFIGTSSASDFAQGAMLVIGLSVLLGMADEWQDKELLLAKVFWPLRRRVGVDELKIVVGVYAVAVLVYWWLIV